MTNVVPFESKKRLEVSLQPADLSVAQAAVAALVKGTQIPPSIEDLPAYKKTMAEFLAHTRRTCCWRRSMRRSRNTSGCRAPTK